MAFFNLAFLALACATTIAEPVSHKRNDQRLLMRISSKTVIWSGKDAGHLVEKGSSNVTIDVKSEDGAPPHKNVDTAELYELINEHMSSLQAMPQNENQQLQSVGEAKSLEARVNVTIGGHPNPASYNIEIQKNSTLS